jgi:malate dehydrogenase
MDTMTYLALKSLLPKNRIIGMGGALDSSVLEPTLGVDKPAKRFLHRYGDTTMIPLTRLVSL